MGKNARTHVDVISIFYLLLFPSIFLSAFSCSRLKYEEIMEVEKKIEGIEEEAKKYAAKKYDEVVALLEEVRSFYARRQKLKAKSILDKLRGEINNLEQEINRIKKKGKESETTGKFQKENINVGTEGGGILPEGKEEGIKLMQGSMLIMGSGHEEEKEEKEEKEVQGKTTEEIFGEEFTLESLLNDEGKKEKRKKEKKRKKTERKRIEKKAVRKTVWQKKKTESTAKMNVEKTHLRTEESTSPTKNENQNPQNQKFISTQTQKSTSKGKAAEEKENITEEILLPEKPTQQNEELDSVNSSKEIKDRDKMEEEPKTEVEQHKSNSQKEMETEGPIQEGTTAE